MATTPPAGLDSQALQAYQRDGYHIARGLLDPHEVDQIRHTFMEQAKNGPVPGLSEVRHHEGADYTSADPLRFYPRMMHPHRHADKPVGPLSMRYLLDPRIGAVLRDLLEDEPIAAQTMFYFKPAGARGQDFHQDNFYLRVQPGSCMAAWIAIDDADAENGGMMVVPGSHRMDVVCPEHTHEPDRFFTTEHVPVPQGMRTEQCILRAGDVLFFNGSLIHGSYPNTSKDRFRRSLICHYVPQGCIEVAHFYRPLFRFNGEEALKQVATGGGPCGTPLEASAPH